MGLQPESREAPPVKFKEKITLAVIGTRPISKKCGAWVLTATGGVLISRTSSPVHGLLFPAHNMFSRIFRRNPTAPRAAGISALGVGAGRDLFEVEAMEPRILLSAAPIDVPLAVANVSALPDTQVASDLSVQHSPASSERAAPCARRRVSYGIPIILPLSASGAIFPACANMRAPVSVPPPMSSRRICSMRSRQGTAAANPC